MNQKIFETHQKADELLQEALYIWRNSSQSDYLEGIEDDPILSLLMSAIAYQENSFDSELENLKVGVLNEYIQTLLPYGMQHAVPATAVVTATLQESISSMVVNADTKFMLNDSEYEFVPLLETQAFNLRVNSIKRMDGKRWKVVLKSPFPIKELTGFSFAVKTDSFHSLTVFVKGKPLPLISPWQYADLPLSSCFSLDTMLYNRQQIFNASTIAFDLFARHNLNLYCVRPFQLTDDIGGDGNDTLEMFFEFSGITDEFVFSKQHLELNTVLLANVSLHSTTLSTETPIYRVENGQFLHLLKPNMDEIHRDVQVNVRKIAAERFNSNGLLKLLRYLINKYDTDYYAFQHIQKWHGDGVMEQLRNIWSRILEKNKESDNGVSGVYLMLQQLSKNHKDNVSLKISYVTTDGAKVNDYLDVNSTFNTIYGFDNALIQQIIPPIAGCDELSDNDAVESMTRYYVTTQDRIVTFADIKAFCFNELLIRYGIDKSLINSINIDRRLRREPWFGFEIIVDIRLNDTPFIIRNFAPYISQAETLLCKMVEVRSTHIYPIHINIEIDKQ